MKYVVTIAGREITFELDGETVVIDGRRVPAHLQERPGSPVAVLRLGDSTHDLVIEPGSAAGEYVIHTDSGRFEVEVEDERSRAVHALSRGARKDLRAARLVAPMPGLIVRVEVSAGDAVEAGQSLVVMEAMKMENELRATASGVVQVVRVEKGAAVEKGAVLIEFA